MKISHRFERAVLRNLLCTAALSLSLNAWADGPADLKSALTRLQGTAPLRASATVEALNRTGKGKETDETSGQLNLALEEGAQGLRLDYSADVLKKVAAEKAALDTDPKAKSPLTLALGKSTVAQLHALAAAAPTLASLLGRATFKGEQPDSWNGKAARKLSYELALGGLSERERKYVKSFDGTLDLWVDADGTPLASRVHQHVTARLLLMISFETTEERSANYAVIGDRLVAVRDDDHLMSSGSGEESEQRTIITLQPKN